MSRLGELRREIEAAIGYAFADGGLLITALTHVSAIGPNAKRTASYQRLEFLGDHVLGLVVSDMLYRAYPEAEEGELSKRLADLVRRETCAAVGEELGLVEAIQTGPGGGASVSRLRASVLADVCEAVIGAVYLDGGYVAASALIEANWRERLAKPMAALRDPKTVLQEWALGRGLPVPAYREVSRSGPDHKPQFKVAVALPGLAEAEGVGRSKQAAEKAAASALLRREGVIGASEPGEDGAHE